MSITTLTSSDVEQLKTAFRGTLIQPTDTEYETVRKVYNGMIDKRPRLIARCTDVADVVAGIRFARDHHLTLAVRGGGHNGGGLGTCDDGVVLDLSTMKSVRVDPTEQTVRVAAGSTWGDVDHATYPFGLVVPGGTISTTGVAGLTLGGGIGHFTRKYGLTIDNLLSADIVLADGSLVVASEREHPDLFWAIRGGGGNFGVVTSFLFKGRAAKNIIGGPMLWNLEHGPAVMRWYREFITTAPDDITGFFAFLVVPPAPMFPETLHLKGMCGIIWNYTGPADRVDAVLAPARKVARPAFEFVGEMPFPMLNSAFDALYPPGLQWYWRADFVNELGDAAITRHLEHGSRLPTMHSTVHLYPINGAARRVVDDATPWAFRRANWAEVIVGVDPDPSNKDKISTWCKQYWEALHPYSAGGAYVNFMMDEGHERVQATYGKNYARLAKIKAKYDPDNVFCVNQNVKPAA